MLLYDIREVSSVTSFEQFLEFLLSQFFQVLKNIYKVLSEKIIVLSLNAREIVENYYRVFQLFSVCFSLT